MEELFQRFERDTCDEGWKSMEPDDDEPRNSDIARKNVGVDEAMVRTRMLVPIALSDYLTINRPETIFDPEHGFIATNPHIGDSGVERIYSPGDAIVWFRAKATPLVKQVAVALNSAQQSRELDDAVYHRMTLRRDFPEIGKFMMVISPFDRATGKLVPEIGIGRQKVVIAEADGDAATRVNSHALVQRSLAWTMKYLDQKKSIEEQLANYKKFKISHSFEMSVTGSLRYVFLSIKKQHRGPPLLPPDTLDESQLAEPSAWQWEQTSESFTLPCYLRIFVCRLGHPELAAHIYDRCDGQSLAPFQAIVQARIWERIWAILELPYSEMRAAYRRRHGGTHAPVIKNTEPRFLPWTMPPMMADEANREQEPHTRVQVINTFYHFSEEEVQPPPGLNRRERCDTSPMRISSMLTS